MELYLDSAKIDEVREASKLGFLTGLTTTPTFLHRDGIKDVDGTIVALSKMVNILHIEALGNNAEEIVGEAERLLGLGLDSKRVVFKIPISLEGVKACKILTDRGIQVNLHLVYTIQQAYMAFCAGATYVCVLVGRMQDQGQDALSLIEECLKAVEKYHYKTKIMFSSVRNLEHIRNAINIGVHTCTLPWNILKQLTENSFTEIGLQQFVKHTELLMLKAADVMVTENIFLNYNSTILEGLILMTNSELGAVIILDDQNKMYRIFTDGDLRRLLKSADSGSVHKKFRDLESNNPVSVEVDTPLIEVLNKIKETEFDNLVIVENGVPRGIVDIQDLVKWI